MKTVALFALSALLVGAAGAQSRPMPVVHHAVSTNADAQAAFDRGLLDYYAYNPEAAEHEFYTASDLDPHMAMAWWGIALSNAPNLNVPPTDDRDEQAREAIAQAKDLEHYAAPEDRAFIDAASARFDGPAKAKLDTLQRNYSAALKKIAIAYPTDGDAAALYAESALYVVVDATHPDYDHPTSAQVASFRAHVRTLLPMFQAYLAKFPENIGLLHFYIHTAQNAGQSQLAVATATKEAAFGLPPEDSHLTHMSGHIFFDVGMYDAGLDVATRSVAMDDAEIACCHPGYYSATRYYYDHNLSFLFYALTETGRTAEAVTIARQPGKGMYLLRQLVAAGRWADAVALPAEKRPNATAAFARGIAYAKLGNATQARKALDEIPNVSAMASPEDATHQAMRLTLSAEIAQIGNNDAKAIAMLMKASKLANGAFKITGAEMPALYFFSPNMTLAEVATKLGKTNVARAALEGELTVSPRSPAALRALAHP
jgi:tetratricopeptide (TPR) repeat protein